MHVFRMLQVLFPILSIWLTGCDETVIFWSTGRLQLNHVTDQFLSIYTARKTTFIELMRWF